MRATHFYHFPTTRQPVPTATTVLFHYHHHQQHSGNLCVCIGVLAIPLVVLELVAYFGNTHRKRHITTVITKTSKINILSATKIEKRKAKTKNNNKTST